MANAASGMVASDECKLKFMELRRKKAYRYIIFKIDDQAKEIIVDKVGGPDETYDSFSSSLPEHDPRFGVFDYDFVTQDNRKGSKIFFITWAPDVSRIKSKMLYASSKDGFRKELDGIHYDLQATDPTELDIELMKERVG